MSTSFNFGKPLTEAQIKEIFPTLNVNHTSATGDVSLDDGEHYVWLNEPDETGNIFGFTRYGNNFDFADRIISRLATHGIVVVDEEDEYFQTPQIRQWQSDGEGPCPCCKRPL